MGKRILTGLKATSSQLHIGNYFGAVKPMVDLLASGEFDESFLFVANMHSYIGVQDGEDIRQYTINIVKTYLAAGIDPVKTYIYNPAMIPGHAQMTWIFSCLTNIGFMKRMHAFKDAVNKGNADDQNVGLFTYPILMAADILLYDADAVPVGKDQKQHVEYARDIAMKFNSKYGETFHLPDVYTQENVAVIPGLDGRKMSKSYNNYIGMMDDEATLKKKVSSIPTGSQAIEDPKDPDECNVYQMLKLFVTEEEDVALRKRYTDGGLAFKDVKIELYEKLVETLAPIKEKYESISDEEVVAIIEEHTAKVSKIVEEKIADVYKKVGFDLGK